MNRRVVAVTGASRGGGKGIALALSATGAVVCVSRRSPPSFRAARGETPRYGKTIVEREEGTAWAGR